MKLNDALREYRESLEMEVPPDLGHLFEEAAVQSKGSGRKIYAAVAAGLAIAASVALVLWPKPERPANRFAPVEAIHFVPIEEAALLPEPRAYQILQVEVDETRLLALGLRQAPVAARGRVKAQVLLGEDGIARAIRILDTVNVQ
ncbi:MAG: hypothetical protein NW208_12825 [Bryobacter sp.]|nr:hypothetical protein [Bryobacter sp.]